MVRTPAALVGFLKRYDPDVRRLARGLRALVLDELAPCHETIVDAGYTVAVHFGPGARVSDAIVYLAAYRQHVNLGFLDGAALDDPGGVLEGTGSRMRHVKIRTVEDLANPVLRQLIRLARTDAGLAPFASGGTRRVTSSVKRFRGRTALPR